MTTAPPVFPAPAKVLRPHRRMAPLRVWVTVFVLFAVAVASSGAYFAFATPMPTADDSRFFRSQLADLDRQVRLFRENDQRPISIVFIGTSRMKNVAFDADQLRSAAKAAGVARPVASTFLAVNWGGFERFGPVIEQIRERRPDAVVMMPELFYQDFNLVGRASVGFRYLRSRLWAQEFKIFDDREFLEPACAGFEEAAEDRIDHHDSWMTEGRQLPGPKLAREAVKTLSDRGILIIIADVPASRTVAASRPAFSGPAFMRETGLGSLPNVRAAWSQGPLADSAYCDWAHIDPARAGLWQRGFFAKAADDLARLTS